MAGHSKLGASSTHRWMKCPGSVALIERLGERPDDEGSEHAARGTVAHYVAAECLAKDQDAWEYGGFTQTVDGHKITLDGDDTTAIQVYLDDARKRDPEGQCGTRLIEHAFHCPDVDPDFYGTADLVDIGPEWLEVTDYKHGAGVVVEVERNTQLMQYAAGTIMSLALEDATIPERVRLRIVQPRAFHPNGPIRVWETTTPEIMRWVEEEWKPAAARTKAGDAPLVSGDHCRFCPLKDALKCPELVAAVERVKAVKDEPLTAMEEWRIGALLADCEVVKIFEKALRDEAFNRLQKGKQVDGWKLADKRADRVWKPGAEPQLIAALGDAAWAPRVLVSPAQAEKLPGGGDLVKRLAFKPDNGVTIAKVTDARQGRAARTAKQVFAGLLDTNAPA